MCLPVESWVRLKRIKDSNLEPIPSADLPPFVAPKQSHLGELIGLRYLSVK